MAGKLPRARRATAGIEVVQGIQDSTLSWGRMMRRRVAFIQEVELGVGSGKLNLIIASKALKEEERRT